MMTFTSPKNFKNGRLIANRYRVIDIVIASICFLIPFIAIWAYVVLFNGRSIPFILFVLFPPLIVGMCFLIPSTMYHNVATRFWIILMHRIKRRTYIWEGVYYYESENKGE